MWETTKVRVAALEQEEVWETIWGVAMFPGNTRKEMWATTWYVGPMKSAMPTEHRVLPSEVDIGTQRLSEGVPQFGRVACSKGTILHSSWAILIIFNCLHILCYPHHLPLPTHLELSSSSSIAYTSCAILIIFNCLHILCYPYHFQSPTHLVLSSSSSIA